MENTIAMYCKAPWPKYLSFKSGCTAVTLRSTDLQFLKGLHCNFFSLRLQAYASATSTWVTTLAMVHWSRSWSGNIVPDHHCRWTRCCRRAGRVRQSLATTIFDNVVAFNSGMSGPQARLAYSVRNLAKKLRESRRLCRFLIWRCELFKGGSGHTSGAAKRYGLMEAARKENVEDLVPG